MVQVLDGLDKKQANFHILTRPSIQLRLGQELQTYIKPGDHDDNILFDDNIIHWGNLSRSQQFHIITDTVVSLNIKNYRIQDTT